MPLNKEPKPNLNCKYLNDFYIIFNGMSNSLGLFYA